MTDGFRVYKPRLKVTSAKLAYALECVRIWVDDMKEIEMTGSDPHSYVPTESEFMEAQRIFGANSGGGTDGRQ